jgi:endonuclease/exonuclease/phosphatase family metal-dependent hydrolase
LFHTSLARQGPGLLLRDIASGKDPQVKAVVQVIAGAAPDILLLLDVDYDHGLVALTALRDSVASAGVDYPHVFALPPNTGVATGLDLDGDRRFGGPRDAQGYGQFAGQGGMAILSRYPVLTRQVQDHSTRLWRDMPGALLTLPDGTPLMWPDVLARQRLSSTGHWVVPVNVRGQTIWLLAFHATPPVFDGPEDRNGRRNHDEARFWSLYLDGAFGFAPKDRFVIIGDSNMDPDDSEGRPGAMRALLRDPRLFDPQPKGGGAALPTAGQRGDPALDTVRWPDPALGNFRVDYILPSADLSLRAARVYWPAPGDPMAATVQTASRHHLVSVTLEWPPAATARLD